MRISWNWLSEMVDLSAVAGSDQLAELLTSRGLEVEAIERQGQGFEKVITARILERNPHPQADRLSLCKVSLGSGDPLEIVCGAQNMKAGDTVALAQIGAQLPNGLKIAQSKIRGVASYGMLCSEEELQLKAESEGILILPAETPLGRPLAEILGRNDTILAFKLTANRGDCLSHFGMAREVAAALGQKAKPPKAAPLPATPASFSIALEAGESAPQFFGVSIEGVRVGPSPQWLISRLEAMGSRSVNNIVDATNFVMWELGHPVHAYDADKIQGKQIGVRFAQPGEALPLLDGSEARLKGSELVIFDAERAIGLAGVMGGGNSEVTDSTLRLFLECAEFSSSLVRKASTAHQKKTDASHRFERGIDPLDLPKVSARLATLITELAGGRITGASFAQTPGRRDYKPAAIPVEPGYFARFLGMPKATPERVREVLGGLECEVRVSGSNWSVTPPSYRRDLSIQEDLAEEVARSLGYAEIEETVPRLSSAPTSLSASPSAAQLELLFKAKDILSRLGLSEAVNYSFTSKAWLSKFGMKAEVSIINPLSEEHEAMVPSLIPGLVQSAIGNWNHHFGSEALPLRLFEIRPTFHSTGEVRAVSNEETGVQERWKLALAVSGPRLGSGLRNELGEVDFYDLKAVVEELFQSLGARGVRVQPTTESSPLFHPGQGAEVLAGKDRAGFFGLLHPQLSRSLKLRAPLWIAELDWGRISQLSRSTSQAIQFKEAPQFPAIERDFALIVKTGINSDKITQLALKSGRPLAKVAKIFDVYRGSQLPQGMTSVAVRVIFYEEDRSLQEAEVESVSAEILKVWEKELGAQLRG